MSKELSPKCPQRDPSMEGRIMGQLSDDSVKQAVKTIFAVLVLTGFWIFPQSTSAVNLSNSVELSVSVGSNRLPARLYRPPGFDTSTNLLPLVIVLHGVGESGTDNVAQVSSHIGGLINATQGTNYSAFLLAGQIPVGADWRQAQWRTLTLNALQ